MICQSLPRFVFLAFDLRLELLPITNSAFAGIVAGGLIGRHLNLSVWTE
jgi:hypothetical protein